MTDRTERAQRVAVEAGRRGVWTVETCQAWMAQSDQMTEEEMQAWERAVEATEEA